MESLLIKLPNWMGDILFSFDLLHTLSLKIPRLALLTSDQHAGLFDTFPFQNAESITYPQDKWPYLSLETYQKIDRFRPDAGLLLPNSVGSAIILRYAGISNLLGYATEKRGVLLKKSLPVPVQKLHQADYYSNLSRLFDLDPIAYPIPVETSRGSTVVIHPGASKVERAWNLDRYVEVSEILKNHGMRVVFVSGEKLQLDSDEVIIDPSLGDFCTMLQNCSLFIGNDSGPLHLAQQCGAPVIGIYGPGDPMVTGPRKITSNAVLYHNFPCSPCRQKYFQECSPAPTGKPFCIDTIQTNEVIRAVGNLLQKEIRV